MPDRGLAHAFNLGLAQAKGDWLVYLNTDDFFLENSTIEQMVPHLMLNKEADVVFGRIMSVSREVHPSPLPLKRIFYGKPWSWHTTRWQAVIPHPAAFTNRKYFNQVGGFDESLRIVLDYEFYLRARLSLKAVFVPLTLSAMRVGGLSGGNQVLRMWREYRQVQQKAGVASVPLIWLNFFWNIALYFLRAFFHGLLDPYSSKITLKFKNRMTGIFKPIGPAGPQVTWSDKKES
jgi:GT2 family glycosyltransferase